MQEELHNISINSWLLSKEQLYSVTSNIYKVLKPI